MGFVPFYIGLDAVAEPVLKDYRGSVSVMYSFSKQFTFAEMIITDGLKAGCFAKMDGLDSIIAGFRAEGVISLIGLKNLNTQLSLGMNIKDRSFYWCLDLNR